MDGRMDGMGWMRDGLASPGQAHMLLVLYIFIGMDGRMGS